MIRVATAAALAALAAAACAETPDRQANAASGMASDTSASSPMTVNPAPPGTTPSGQGQAMPSTPPTLTEDPARQADDKAMPPGPVNPGV